MNYVVHLQHLYTRNTKHGDKATILVIDSSIDRFANIHYLSYHMISDEKNNIIASYG